MSDHRMERIGLRGAVVSSLSIGMGLALWQASPAQAEGPAAKYEANWESLRDVPVPKWFDDAKFGIFIHWGPYSVPGYLPTGRGYAEHFPQRMYREPEKFYPFLKMRFGAAPPEFGYKDLIPMFRADKWDPEAWADLFAKAGARYVIPVGEHHDGFAMWDSQLTDWNAVRMGPKRDVIGELAEACRAKGLKYGVSYHRERHYWFFGRQKMAAGPPHDDIAEEIRRVPSCAGLYGPFRLDDAFMRDYVARWKEIQDKYRPDFMWIDDQPAGGAEMETYLRHCAGMIADYLNQADRWGKELYLNNKGGRPNWPGNCGCREKDNLQLPQIGPKWQNPATLGTSYGYMKSEEQSDAYKSPTQLIHLLCDVVSKNGNLLLNIGPRADGTIPEAMRTRLLAMGAWLEVNGEAIYGTRHWKAFGQDRPPLRFTAGPKTLYVIALAEPKAPFTVEATKGWKAGDVEAVTLLGSAEKVGTTFDAAGLTITPPAALPGRHAWVFKVRTSGEPGH